jgi:hypothetical protein
LNDSNAPRKITEQQASNFSLQRTVRSRGSHRGR